MQRDRQNLAYAASRFQAAATLLHASGGRSQADTVAMAFHECSFGLRVAGRYLDEGALYLAQALEIFMDVKGLDFDRSVGAWSTKAAGFGARELQLVMDIVDTLASWLAAAVENDPGSSDPQALPSFVYVPPMQEPGAGEAGPPVA